MQQATQTPGVSVSRSSLPVWEAEPSLTSSSFASLLSELAEPEEKALPKWNDEGFADDVASLSYERALRAHARYRPAEPDHAPERAATKPATLGRNSRELPSKNTLANAEQGPKSASITLRISQAECTQLRERAAEAGLTVSAYLRSCAFEVESLRAQVKEALAQMRPEHRAESKFSADTDQRSGSRWLARLLPGLNRAGNTNHP